MHKKQDRPEHKEGKSYIGTHIVADFWGCEIDDNAEVIRKILVRAAKASNAKVLDSISHQFKLNNGSTALVLLAESHISAHSWPEYDYIAIDIFTCGQNMKPQEAIKYLKQHLKPQNVTKRLVRRGKGIK